MVGQGLSRICARWAPISKPRPSQRAWDCSSSLGNGPSSTLNRTRSLRLNWQGLPRDLECRLRRSSRAKSILLNCANYSPSNRSSCGKRGPLSELVRCAGRTDPSRESRQSRPFARGSESIAEFQVPMRLLRSLFDFFGHRLRTTCASSTCVKIAPAPTLPPSPSLSPLIRRSHALACASES
jgi:hypothetical protein